MPIPIILPKFGFTLESSVIVEWLKQEGDTVREGDPIAEVETDKVNMEVESTADGTVFKLLYAEGDEVPVTEVMAYLLAPGEEAPADWQPPQRSTASTETAENTGSTSTTGVRMTPVARRIVDEHALDVSSIAGTGPHGRIVRQDVEPLINVPPSKTPEPDTHTIGKIAASPAARRIAAELGIELAQVPGTGPAGRIQGFDVRAYAEQTPEAKIAPTVSQQITSLPQGEQQIVKLRGMRKTIAARLQRSFQDAPHIFFDASIDMRRIESLRSKIKAQEEKLSVTALIVKACAYTLVSYPYMNATFDGENITLWENVNIGVAVALDEGLIVPVVKAVNRARLRDVQGQIMDFASRARDNQLRPDELQDGTFTVSNLGMYGVDRFTAIINPPQVAILAVGRTQQIFVPDDDVQPVLQPTMQITLSADHRVVDGATVAQFIRDLKMVLEDPMLLVW